MNGLVIVVAELRERDNSRKYSIRVRRCTPSYRAGGVVLNRLLLVFWTGLKVASNGFDRTRSLADHGTQWLDRIVLHCLIIVFEERTILGNRGGSIVWLCLYQLAECSNTPRLYGSIGIPDSIRSEDR